MTVAALRLFDPPAASAGDSRPVHLIARPGDRQALCGTTNPLPHVTVRHAPTHTAGWNMTICPQCDTRQEVGE